MPWYFAFIISVSVIIIGLYKKLNIGLAMIIGAITLGLLSQLSLFSLYQVTAASLLNSVTVMLVLSILQLGILGHILKKTGALEAIIDSLNSMVSDLRAISVAMPMLIGMLTVPGGAILSAPICAQTGENLGLPPEKQAAINIWFRHVLYFMLPLFPSLILASQLSGISLGRFVAHNILITIIGTVLGFKVLFRGYRNVKPSYETNLSRLRELLISISPLLLIFVMVVFLGIYFPLALLSGIILALTYALPVKFWPKELLSRIKTLLLPGINLALALVIIGIMFFKEMLTSTNVIVEITSLLLMTNIPIIILIIVISFLVGLLVGDNSASIAILFPLFIPLAPEGYYTFSAYMSFVYVCSVTGHMISPAHPCFSLSKEYYRIDMIKIAALIAPLLVVAVTSAFLLTICFGFY